MTSNECDHRLIKSVSYIFCSLFFRRATYLTNDNDPFCSGILFKSFEVINKRCAYDRITTDSDYSVQEQGNSP